VTLLFRNCALLAAQCVIIFNNRRACIHKSIRRVTFCSILCLIALAIVHREMKKEKERNELWKKLDDLSVKKKKMMNSLWTTSFVDLVLYKSSNGEMSVLFERCMKNTSFRFGLQLYHFRRSLKVYAIMLSRPASYLVMTTAGYVGPSIIDTIVCLVRRRRSFVGFHVVLLSLSDFFNFCSRRVLSNIGEWKSVTCHSWN